MPSISDVKKIIKVEDIDEVNNYLATGNWILVDTQHYIPELKYPDEYIVQYLIGRVK